jgi:fused signal recognition particle receptor
MEIVLLVLGILIVAGVALGVVAARRGADRGQVLEPPPPVPPIPAREPEPEPVLDLDDADLNEPSSGVGLAPRPGEPPPAEEVGGDAAVADPDPATVAEIEDALSSAVEDVQDEAARPGFRDRLAKARGVLSGYLGTVLGRERIDAGVWDELEEALLKADVGITTTTSLLDDLRKEVAEKGIDDPEALIEQLKGDLKARLALGDRSLAYEPGRPNVWLMVGVNGVGKTTSIGKIGKQQMDAGRTVVMAAGDTFRAAAAEQLGMWAERTGADFVRGAEGGDPSSVIFDAVQRASSKGAELVLADTAGRLHTKTNLMEELKKVRRVADKEPGTVTEVLLVLDAVTGQNGLAQAREFLDAVEVTGIVLTKLDGSAKGGIVLAIQHELGVPIKLVGLGESVNDLVEFDPDEFVEALFS